MNNLYFIRHASDYAIRDGFKTYDEAMCAAKKRSLSYDGDSMWITTVVCKVTVPVPHPININAVVEAI